MSESSIQLSAITVTYNPGSEILDCIQSLYSTTVGFPTEVIIVDNASTNDMMIAIQQTFPTVYIVRNDSNLGFGEANNIGVARAQGEYIALVNPDVVVKPEALEHMVDYLRQNPDIGVVGPRTFKPTGEISFTARPPHTVFQIAGQYLYFANLIPRIMYGSIHRVNMRATAPTSVPWLQGSCLVMRREIFERINGFDSGFLSLCGRR